MTNTSAPTAIAEREVVITRIFNAPRALVWKAWTDPAMYKKWWGPKKFTCPTAKLDVRVGGTYHACMRSPEGQEFWSTGTYREVVPMEKLVATDSFADEQGNVVPASHYGMAEDFPLQMLVTVTFEDAGDNRTKMTLRHLGLPEGTVEEMTQASWNESFDKLAASL